MVHNFLTFKHGPVSHIVVVALLCLGSLGVSAQEEIKELKTMVFDETRPARVRCFQAGKQVFDYDGILRIKADVVAQGHWVWVLVDKTDEGADRGTIVAFGGDTLCAVSS